MSLLGNPVNRGNLTLALSAIFLKRGPTAILTYLLFLGHLV